MNWIRILCICMLALIPTWGMAETITVVTEEYPPYNYTENGTVTGFSTEFVETILEKAGIDYTIKCYPWARAYDKALKNENVLIYSIGRTEKRENLFKWVDVIAPYDVYLFKLKNRSDIVIKNLDDAKNYKIGVVRDDVRMQYLERKGFSTDKNLDVTSSDEFNLKKIKVGRIDLFPIDRIGGAHVMKQKGYDSGNFQEALYLKDLSSGLYMAFSKKTSDMIVDKCKKVLDALKKDGTFDRIQDKYLK